MRRPSTQPGLSIPNPIQNQAGLLALNRLWIGPKNEMFRCSRKYWHTAPPFLEISGTVDACFSERVGSFLEFRQVSEVFFSLQVVPLSTKIYKSNDPVPTADVCAEYATL
jgi:hypothetical protein